MSGFDLVNSLKDFPPDTPDSDRVLYFLHWVSNKRANDDNTIPRSERTRCPMVWCRKPFDEPVKLFNHIQTCKALRFHIYWCWHCARQESFASPLENQQQNVLGSDPNAIDVFGRKINETVSHTL